MPHLVTGNSVTVACAYTPLFITLSAAGYLLYSTSAPHVDISYIQ